MDKVHEHNSFNINTPSSESYKNDAFRFGKGYYKILVRVFLINESRVRSTSIVTRLRTGRP
jgi:hypothetical protein